MYHDHMTQIVKISNHVFSHLILNWLVDHVGVCVNRGVFTCEGEGWSWRYSGDGIRMGSASHVITFDPEVDEDLIMQFVLTWV
jgi:hypothetical protein